MMRAVCARLRFARRIDGSHCQGDTGFAPRLVPARFDHVYRSARKRSVFAYDPVSSNHVWSRSRCNGNRLPT